MLKLTAIGNLGKNPEMRYTPAGEAVTSFSIATTRKWTSNNGQSNKETTWLRISVWGKLAENCNQYLTKGNKVYIEGRLNVDPKSGGPKMFTRQDGTLGTAFEVTANIVEFLTPKGDGSDADETDADQATGTPEVTGDQEIPF